MRINTIRIYNIENINEKTNDEILKEITNKTIKQSRKILKPYDVESEDYFYDNMHLGKIEGLIYETSKTLEDVITYKKHKLELQQIQKDILCGRERYHGNGIIEDVINDVAWQYFKDDEELLHKHIDDAEFHFKYLVKKFRKMINVLCRVMRENDVPLIYH